MTPIARSSGIISDWTSLGTQATPQQSLVCQHFEGLLKRYTYNLPPMWMDPEWRQGRQKSCGGHPG